MAYTTLAQGSSATITITDQFDGLEVINRTQDLATVALASGAWSYGVTPQQHSGRRVYQLTGAGSITVTASSGALQYELTDAADNRVAQSFSVAETASIRGLVSAAGILVGQTGVPVILPSGGTIGNNGALSGITALPTTYSTGCYMYFPASAIFSGSLTGLYYVVMSSTTAGTIYNNAYVLGQPDIPAGPTPFVCTGPGAFVQATSQIDLITFAVPANAMGKNGRLVIRGRCSGNNNANVKSPRVAFGAMVLANSSIANQLGAEFYSQVQNRGVTNAQVGPAASFSTMGLTTNAAVRGTEDTTAVVNVVFGCTVGTAGDYVMWEQASVECVTLA
jgi:hypothetical protein